MKTMMMAVCAMAAATAVAKPERVYVQMETTGLDDYEKAAELAVRFGGTHLYANQIDPSMWQWDAAMNRKDPYPNWTMHRPAFFKFYVPEKLRKYIPEDYTEHNLKVVRARYEILKKHGLKAVYSSGIGPSYLPEQVFVDHPDWRGPRCDHPRRARLEYYAPCIDNPEVREMYVEAVRELCKACPFEYFDVMCNDSAAGLCHFQLYSGKNGPVRCERIPSEVRLISWLSAIQEGAAQAGCKAQINFNRYLRGDVEIFARPLLKPGMSLKNKRQDGKPATAIIGFPNRFGETTFPVAYLPRMVTYAKQLQAAELSDANWHITLKGTDEVDAIDLIERAIKQPIGQGQVACYKALNTVAADFVGEADAAKLVSVWDDIEEILTRMDIFREGPGGANYGLLALVHQRWLTRPMVCFPERLQGEERDYWRNYLFQATTEENALDYINLQGWNTLDGVGIMTLSNYVRIQVSWVFDRAVKSAEGLVAKAKDAKAKRYLRGLVYRLKLFDCLSRTFNNYIYFRNLLKYTRDEPMFHYYVTGETPYPKDEKKREVEQKMREEIGNALEQVKLIEAAAKEGLEIIQHTDKDEFTNVMNLPPIERLVKEMRMKAAIMEKYRSEPSEIYRADHAPDTNY